MTAQPFDHERVDVYRLSIDYVARSFEAAQPLEGLHRHARDQWLRAAQTVLKVESAAVEGRWHAEWTPRPLFGS
jgi:hypothetical protein